MTLALLITAVGGAWAEESESITTTLPEAKTGSVEFTGTHFKITGQRADTDGMNLGSSTNRTITISALNGEIITKVEMTISFKFYSWEWEVLSTKGNVSGNYTTGYNLTLTDVDVSEVTLSASNTTTGYLQFNKFKIFYTMPAGTMTLNTDNTVATMSMPAYDATVDYELVRDMSIQMTATMGDGTDGLRYRVKKAQQGEGYEPADMDMTQVLALVAVNDGIEQKALTLNQDYYCRIYKLDEQTLQPEGDGVKLTDFDFVPGLYALKAVAQDDSDYAGETALSNTFKLFQGYEIVVAANEYATYYKDEALYIEDEDAQLYTITAVGKETATATEVTTAAANMPILVKNNSTETKTILLIPTTDQTPDDVTAADEFLGTLTVKEFTADETSTASYYVCNGKEFVQVRGAGSLGANKAYLKLGGSAAVNAPRLVIGFGGEGTTGISEEVRVKSEEFATAPYYDLNGRKLQGKPTQKGVYIQNGKKVVVK